MKKKKKSTHATRQFWVSSLGVSKEMRKIKTSIGMAARKFPQREEQEEENVIYDMYMFPWTG
jgi:hypothetical protein